MSGASSTLALPMNVSFSMPGTLVARRGEVPFSVPFDMHVEWVYVAVGIAPYRGAALFDVCANGRSLFGFGRRPTLFRGYFSTKAAPMSPLVRAGERITVDVLCDGSAEDDGGIGAAADVTVLIWYSEPPKCP